MTHQGWTNYETFAVYLWLSNDAGTFLFCRRLARECREAAPTCPSVQAHCWTPDEAPRFLLSDRLKEYFEGLSPLTDPGTVFADLLNSALAEVNWHEIAEELLASQ